MNHKKNMLLTVLSIIMFLIGGFIFFYPTISNYIANKDFEKIIGDYENVYAEMPKENLTDEYNKAVQYNSALVGDPVYDPFVPGTGYQLPDNYEEVLNINKDGIMGFIEIPKIAVKIPIYHGSSEKTLEKGVGHLEMSALPIGGVGNNPILTGHRGLPRAELFTRLDELKIGDKIYIHVLNDILAYEVDNIITILPDKLTELAAYKDKDMITLITCTPYGINTHRLVVQGHRVEYIPKEKEKIKVSRIARLSESFLIRIVGTVLGIVLLFIILFIINKRKMIQKNKETLNEVNLLTEKKKMSVNTTNHKRLKRKRRRRNENKN